MRNKPPAAILKRWWKKSIEEGLIRSGYPCVPFRFEMIYWADLMHEVPLDPRIKDPQNPQYVEYPYVPSEKRELPKPNLKRKKMLDLIEREMDRVFLNDDGTINFESVADKIIHRFFRDLDIYFCHHCAAPAFVNAEAQKTILDRVARVLKKHRRKQIMLIGHSMGSIIAYDALTCRVPDVEIDTLVTAGSPLGLPPIMAKLLKQKDTRTRSSGAPVTPENIKNHWYNLSDLNDKVALNYSLSDDYQPNSRGVAPVDKIVVNDYEYMGKKNPHKSYGYLRTVEMAEIFYDFMTRDRNRILWWVDEKLGEVRKRLFRLN